MGPRDDRPKRRVFTAEYKASILAEYEAADRGQRGQILRREGLYSSHLIEWRRARDAGAQQGLQARPSRAKTDPRDAQIAALTVRAAKAEAELARSKAALEIVGKSGRPWRAGPFRAENGGPVTWVDVGVCWSL